MSSVEEELVETLKYMNLESNTFPDSLKLSLRGPVELTRGLPTGHLMTPANAFLH